MSRVMPPPGWPGRAGLRPLARAARIDTSQSALLLRVIRSKVNSRTARDTLDVSSRALPPGVTVLGLDGLQALIEALAARGHDVIGPVERDGAIVYDHIAGVADLPAGRTDQQEAGSYRLEARSDEALFGYAVGPHS